MKVIDLMILEENLLKLMSKFEIRPEDHIYISMYSEYKELRYEQGNKYEYVINILSMKYNISKSKVKRLIKKMELEVDYHK